MRIKRILAIVLSLMIVFTGVGFAAGDFSDLVEVTNSVFSLPEGTVKSPFSVGEVKGRTVNNTGGTTGDCENLSDFEALVSTVSLYNSSKVFGSNSIKATSTGTGGFGVRTTSGKFKVDSSKYYLVSAYIKSSGIESYLYVQKGSDNSIIKGTSSLSSTTFIRRGLVLQPSDITGETSIKIYIRGFSTQMGDIVFGDGLMINEISASEYSEDADVLMRKYNYVNGTKSTNSVVVKSIGKNILPTDELEWEQGSISTTDGTNSASTVRITTKKYHRINTSQITKSTASGYDVQYIYFYDINRNYISYTTNATYTPPSNAYWYKAIVKNTVGTTIIASDIVNAQAQLEYGSIATTYAKYEKSEVQVTIPFNDGELTRVPNETADSIDLNGGIATQRNKKYVLQSEDITSIVTSGVNIDVVVCNILDNQKIIVNGVSNVGNFIVEGWQETPANGIDNINNIGKFYISNTTRKLVFVVANGRYETLASAQATLAGTTLIYQLATLVTHQLTTPPLISYPNGTITIELAVQDVGIYDNGITISNPDLPIKSMKSVTKISYDEYGNRHLTTISPSNISIENNLKFTITGASEDDRYEYVYHYDNSLTTIPTFKYSVAVTQEGAISGNTDAIQKNGELIELILQQIEELMGMVE